MDMETGQTVQESALHAGRQAWWWPLDTMACSLNDASSTISSSSSLLLGWEWDPQLCYFGLGATGAGAGDSDTDTHAHARELELFVPKYMESPVSEASTAAATGGWTMQKDATAAMPGELDELLMSLWDSDKELAVGFISSCSAPKEKEASATTSSQYDEHSGLSSILPTTVPTSPDKKQVPAPAQAELFASWTSHCNADPLTGDTGGDQTTRANNSSSKRSAAEEEEGAGAGGESSKRSRKQAPCSTAGGAGTGTTVAAYPFAVVKPGGADGSVTLADINRWILTPPARPVRHPVGEFACAPRVSAGNRPAPSGKTVAGFTRLHTAGRGTITIVRTRG